MAKLLLLLFFAHSSLLMVRAAFATENVDKNYPLQPKRIKRSPYWLVGGLYDAEICNGSDIILHQEDGFQLELSVWSQQDDNRNVAAQLGTCQLTVKATSKPMLSYRFVMYTWDREKVSNLSCDAKLNIYDSVGLLVSTC